MANNRAFLYCSQCKDWTTLLKHRADGWYFGAGQELVEPFLEEHKYCSGQPDKAGGRTLEIRYESADSPELELPKDTKRFTWTEERQRVHGRAPDTEPIEHLTRLYRWASIGATAPGAAVEIEVAKNALLVALNARTHAPRVQSLHYAKEECAGVTPSSPILLDPRGGPQSVPVNQEPSAPVTKRPREDALDALEELLEEARKASDYGNGDVIDRCADTLRRAIDGAHSDGRWSTTPPTEPGVYWLRQGDLVRLVQRPHAGVFGEWIYPGTNLPVRGGASDGALWWSEPVEPPR